jgi:hypothetical protein
MTPSASSESHFGNWEGGDGGDGDKKPRFCAPEVGGGGGGEMAPSASSDLCFGLRKGGDGGVR